MIIKVCGLREATNIQAIDALSPDLLGFIYYPLSVRYVGKIEILPTQTPKVGVFVNETFENIVSCIEAIGLQYVQLHGEEDVRLIQQLQQKKVGIIKTFNLHEAFNFEPLEAFAPYCNYFLFDTKGKQYGGNGTKFNWQLLQNYTLPTPFLLSGGITPQDVTSIKAIQHPSFAGVDINSGFEVSPALKDVNAIKQFLYDIRTE